MQLDRVRLRVNAQSFFRSRFPACGASENEEKHVTRAALPPGPSSCMLNATTALEKNMTIDLSREVYDLIATRNRPMLTALDLCIEQLVRFEKDDPARPIRPEMRHQSRHTG
jgi:hypothetical protein